MSTVEEIVQAVKDLPPEKWDEVRRRLVKLWLSSARPDLGDWGVHSKSSGKRSQPRSPAIKIKGQPISQTIVEDRR